MFFKAKGSIRFVGRLAGYLNNRLHYSKQRKWYPWGYGKSLGGGRLIHVSAADLTGSAVRLFFKRKIKREDVCDGKLQPVIPHQGYIRRGGKRFLHMDVPYDEAKALHEALGRALEDAEQLQFDREADAALLRGLALH